MKVGYRLQILDAGRAIDGTEGRTTMAVRGKHQALIELLQDSVTAARTGDHRTSWRLTSEFALKFWLVDPVELPENLPTAEQIEFHVLRAAAADRMELHDESIADIQQWRTLAEHSGDIPSAVLALSALCLAAMVVESDGALVTSNLAASPILLKELAGHLNEAANCLDDLPGHAQQCLALASMAGLTCATSTENEPMRRIFRRLSNQLIPPTQHQGDRLLTDAQQLHADGRTSDAEALIARHLEALGPGVSTDHYEAHDLLGYFALTAGDCPEDMDTHAVLTHWRHCAELALDLGAPVEGMHRAEQVCQLLNADGDYDAAYDLARRYSLALEGLPLSPAQLNLSAVRARAALGSDLLYEAFEVATATADWSSMTPDTERTLACLSIAVIAVEEAADENAQGQALTGDVVPLLERTAALHLDRGEPTAAAQALRTAARARCSSGDVSPAVELMERALRVLEDARDGKGGTDTMLTWHFADWNEDMSAVWEISDRSDLAVGYAVRAARFFQDAQDHSGAALNWVSAAELYLDQGDGRACDQALDRAHRQLTFVPPHGDTDEHIGHEAEDLDRGDNAAWEGYHALRDLRRS